MANLYGQTTRLDYQTDRILDWSDILLDRHTTSLTEKTKHTFLSSDKKYNTEDPLTSGTDGSLRKEVQQYNLVIQYILYICSTPSLTLAMSRDYSGFIAKLGSV